MDQYCVRTEFNFRRSFGQISKVIAAAKALGAETIAITDPNTFGHISFYKAAKAEGLRPVLGVELVCRRAVEDDDKRTVLLYAADQEGLSELYGWTTMSCQQRNCLTYDDLADISDHIIKVAATALVPEVIKCADYAMVNPSSQLLRERAAAMVPVGKLLPMSDTYYPRADNKNVAQLIGVGMKPTPQWMLSRAEASYYMPDVPDAAYANFAELRARISDYELIKAENIHHKMDLVAACRRGITKKFGKRWDSTYEARMQRELATIHEKHFDDYFAMLHGMCTFARAKMLVGPARGSAAGSLVCYLLDITEIDPIEHDLMFERFIDETRYDFPDIDLDFPDSKRGMVFDYLRKTYGAANVAHIGTISRLKAKSAIGETAKRLGVPPWETTAIKDSMIERSGGDSRSQFCINDTFDTMEIGKQFIAKYPSMRAAGDVEYHAWHSGVHAAGALVCNVPVRTYCTVNADGVAELDKHDAEDINLMKVDVLGLRTLSVIEGTGVDVRNVPLDDKAAFAVLCAGRFSGIFQFEGQALQSICRQIGVHAFEDIVAITSLARPGPLHSGGATAFIERRSGREVIEKVSAKFDRITAKTYGMVLYQEQVMSLLREVGRMEWADVQLLRRAMSKSLGLEFFEQFFARFEKGARANGIPHKQARRVWELMVHFGSYGFNRSHAVAYAMISYWCAWLKAHHALEFARSSLAHAKDDSQAKEILREIVNEGQIEYVPFDAEHSGITWSIWDGKLLGGLTGIKGVGVKSAEAIVKARAAHKLTPRQAGILAAPELMYADLFPAQRQFGDYYVNPDAHGVAGKIIHLSEVTQASDGSHVVIVKMLKKDIRDLNETANLAKRGGRRINDNHLLLNIDFEDDTDKIIGTVTRYDYPKAMGKELRDAATGSWWLVRANVMKGYRKLYIKKIRRLA
jgi:DNA polymerase III alpha subunit